jgi:hypothetical protein
VAAPSVRVFAPVSVMPATQARAGSVWDCASASASLRKDRRRKSRLPTDDPMETRQAFGLSCVLPSTKLYRSFRRTAGGSRTNPPNPAASRFTCGRFPAPAANGRLPQREAYSPPGRKSGASFSFADPTTGSWWRLTRLRAIHSRPTSRGYGRISRSCRLREASASTPTATALPWPSPRINPKRSSTTSPSSSTSSTNSAALRK